MEKALFKLTVSKACRTSTILTDLGEFSLAELTPQNALRLWQTGTPHIRITPYGALLLLRHMSERQVMDLVPLCKTRKECAALQDLHPQSDALSEAVLQRCEEIHAQVVVHI